MARRFKRDNFLFPYNLETQRPDVAARPVDAFERADEGTVIQAPQRPFEVNRPDQDNRLLSLARTLGNVQTTVDNVGKRQMEDFTERAQGAGAAYAAEQELRGNRESFQQTIARVRKDEGDEAAQELLRMNPHVSRSFDQTRARTASLQFNAQLQAQFAANPVVDTETGTRLHDVDVSDPRYQRFLNRFTQDFNERNGVSTMDPLAAAAMIPAQQDTTQRITIAQQELRGQRKVRAFSDSTAEFIQTAVYDLHSNVEFINGEDVTAIQDTAAAISAQIDEAHALGLGGGDLDQLYKTTIAQIVQAAETTGNADLLAVAELIETGPEDNRTLLMNTAAGAELAPMLARAADRIVDKDFQTWQRENTIEDREREESRLSSLNNVAMAASLAAVSGNSLEARALLEQAVQDGRAEASEYGYLPEFNATVAQVLQDGMDNTNASYQDHQAMGLLQASIENGDIGGSQAKQEIASLYQSGRLGNNAQAAANLVRLNSLVNAETDQNLAAFSNEVRQASGEVGQAIEQRLGLTRDENNQLTSIKDTLTQNGYNDDQIRGLQDMSQAELNSVIQANAAKAQAGLEVPFSPNLIAAMNMVVNGDLDLFNMPDNPDPADVIRQVSEFENQLWMANEEFKQQNGREMSPQERSQFVRDSKERFLSGQAATLPSSNPASSVGRNSNNAQFAEQAFGVTLSGLSDSSSNPRTTQVMNMQQLTSALRYFIETDEWHPEMVDLARANGMSPMALYQAQAGLNGVEIDQRTSISLGMPIQVPQGGPNEGSNIYANRSSYAPDISANYAPGEYTVFTRNLIDDSPPGTYDFTLIQGSNQKVNVPAPANGRIKAAGWINGYGNTVTVEDVSTGYQYFFAHLDAPAYWQPGDLVPRGAALARQGTTGNSTGPHLHLEIKGRDGQRITNRSLTRPLVDQYLADVQSGYFLPSAARQQPSSTGTGGTGGPNGNFRSTSSDANTRARASLFVQYAERLGVQPDELAAVAFQESSLDPTKKGGDYDDYEGLFQFGRSERATYGINRWSSSADQFQALERFLRDRGYRPEMGIGRLYATILGGNPGAFDVPDSNTTTARNSVSRFQAGGSANTEARRILGW